MPDDLMRVTQLWRYPVKSLAGEALQSATVGERGIEGDRRHGLLDRDSGLVLTARRVPELLFAVPAGEDATTGRPLVELPDGTITGDDTALSAWLGRSVELRQAVPGEHGSYEIAENDDRPEGGWIRWDGPDGVFHDSGRTRVSIVSEHGLGQWDVRRFRPNIVVSGGDERDLLGHRVRIGGVELDVVKEIDRCVIITRPQPGIARDKDVLVQVHQTRSGHFGVGSIVTVAGTITVGDAVQVR